MNRAAPGRTPPWVLAVVLVVFVFGAMSGCEGCVDTELGLDATVDSARVTVAPDDVVSANLQVTYRVGEYAEGDRMFQPNAIELYVADTLVARMVPSVPPTFVQRISPGESRSSPIIGMDTMSSDPRTLCGSEVRVLFRWLDASSDEIGMTEATTSDVTCE